MEASKNKEDEMKYEKLYKHVNELKKEASKLQKEYFEKESELSYIKSRVSSKFEILERNKEIKLIKMKRQEEIRNSENELKKLNEDLLKNPSFFENNTKLSLYLRNQENIDGKSMKEDLDRIMNKLDLEYSQKASKHEKNLNELILNNFAKINKRDMLHSELRLIKSKIAKFQIRKAEIEKENKEKTNQIDVINKEINVLKSKIEDKLVNYEKIISDENRLNNELNNIMRDILSNKAKRNDQAKKAVIKGVIDSLKNIFSGVHGSVIDIIKPTQKKYEVAVGILLSKYDQAVVVENEKVAFDCLRYLKDTKTCKLTFLPISKIRYNKGDLNINNDIFNDQVVLAKNCLNYDPCYEKIVNFIFKTSLIVSNGDLAKKLLYKNKYSGKVCTLNGILFNSFGLITGGNDVANKFEENMVENLLGRRKLILEDLKKNRDRKIAYSDVQIIKEKIDDLNNKKSSIQLITEEMSDIIEEKQVLELEAVYKEVCDELVGFENEKAKIKEFLKQIESEIYYPIMRQLGLKSLEEYKEKQRNELYRQDIILKIDNLKGKLVLLKEDLYEPEIPDNILNIDIVALENSLNILYTSLESAKSNFKASNETLSKLETKRNELATVIIDHKLRVSRLEEDLKDTIAYANMDLGINGINEDFEMEKKCNENVFELKKMLEDINKEIESNIPTLMSEDSSIQTKYNKLNAEYEIAKAAVLNTKNKFSEIKNLRMDCFMLCFSKVSAEIVNVYRDLNYKDNDIGSTNCAYLAFEGDPFINNLKFYLMPPLKRFTEFSELSGGERSIAAISFLFALSSFKTPPFYIFDEVDSALDKINVERLSEYLASTSRQHIVISLKHQLFKKAESLFGVYKCPFENRSKILSYRLKNN